MKCALPTDFQIITKKTSQNFAELLGEVRIKTSQGNLPLRDLINNGLGDNENRIQEFSIQKNNTGESVTFTIKDINGEIIDASSKATIIYNRYKNLISASYYDDTIKDKEKETYFKNLYGTGPQALVQEFNDFIFLSRLHHMGGMKSSKRFTNLTKFEYGSNENTIQNVLDAFIRKSSKDGVLSTLSTSTEKERYAADLKSHLAGFKAILLTEDLEAQNDEIEQNQDEGRPQEMQNANASSPTSYTDALFRLYLSTLYDDGKLLNAQSLLLKLLKDFSGLNPEEIIEKLRDAPANTYLNQIWVDLFSEFDSKYSKEALDTLIPENAANEVARLEIRNQKKKLQTAYEFIRYVRKATTSPFNIVHKEGVVYLNDSIQESTEESLTRTVSGYISTTAKNKSNEVFKYVAQGSKIDIDYQKVDNIKKSLVETMFSNDEANYDSVYAASLHLGIIQAVFENAVRPSEEEFDNYYNSLSASAKLELAKKLDELLLKLNEASKNTDVQKLSSGLNLLKAFADKDEHIAYKNIYKEYISVFSFINDTYSMFPKESTYYKGAAKPVHAISLSYSAKNKITALKKKLLKNSKETLSSQELYLAKVLEYVDENALDVIELVQYVTEEGNTEFGFMSPESYEIVSLSSLTFKDAVPSLRAADRSLERAFKGLLKSPDFLESRALDILKNKLTAELTTYALLTKDKKNNIFNKALQGTLFGQNINKEDGDRVLGYFQGFFDNNVIDELVNSFNPSYSTEQNPDEVFQKIKEEALKHVETFLSGREDLDTNLRASYIAPEIEFHKEIIEKRFGKGATITRQLVINNFGLEEAKLLMGDAEETTLDKLASHLAVKGLMGRLIQQPIIFGNILNYTVDNFKKRTTLFFGTREAASDNLLLDSVMDVLYPRPDGRVHTNEVSYHVFNEVEKNVQGLGFEEYKKNVEEETKILGFEKDSPEYKKYLAKRLKSGIDVIDATAYNTLSFAYATFIKDGGLSFDESAEAAIVYESQLLHYQFLKLGLTVGDILPNSPDKFSPLFSIEDFNRIYALHIDKPLTQEFLDKTPLENFTPSYEGRKIKVENLSSNIPIKKDQGSASVERIINSDGEVFTNLPKEIGLVATVKTAPNTIIPSNTQGLYLKTKEEALSDPEFKLLAILQATNTDFALPPSGEKSMKKAMGGLEISLQGQEGNYKTVITVSDEIKELPKRVISREDFAKQLETGFEDKGKVTFSTQLRRLAFLNLVAINEKTGNVDNIKKLASKFHELLNAQSDSKFIEKVKSLGFPVNTRYNEDSSDYEILTDFNLVTEEGAINETAVNNFIDGIKKQFSARDGYEYVLRTLDEIKETSKNTGLILFDLSTQKDTIEKTLSKAIQSSNKVKTKGESLIQESALLKDPNLKMYSYEQGKNLVSEAEVIIGLPKSLIPFVTKHYVSKFGKKANFAAMLKYFNETLVAEENNKKGLIEPSIFSFIANRIPTQSHASIEVFTVKKFTMPHSGGRAALPLDFVFKSGSDFDVDKLTAYLNSLEVNAEGKLYIPYAGLRNETINKGEYVNDMINTGKMFNNFISNLESLSNYNTEFSNLLTSLKELINTKLESFNKQRKYPEEYSNVLKSYYSIWMSEYMNLEGEASQKLEQINSRQAELLQQAFDSTDNITNITFADALDYLQNKDSFEGDFTNNIKQSSEFQNIQQEYINLITNTPDQILQISAPFDIISNNVIASMRLGILHNSNLTQLYNPVAAPITQEIAAYYPSGAARSYSSLFSLQDEINAFKAFIGAAIPLGQSATANAFHALAQLSPIKYDNPKIKSSLNDLFGNKITETSIGHAYDFNGNLKSVVYNEQISGFVDVAKDPFIMRLGINAMNYNLFFALHEVYAIPYEYVSLTFKLPFLHQGVVDSIPLNGLKDTIGKLNFLLKEIDGKITKDASYKPTVTREWLHMVHESVNKNPYFFDEFFTKTVEGYTLKGSILETFKNKDFKIRYEDLLLLKDIAVNYFQVLEKVVPEVKTLREILRPDSTFANNRLEVSILAELRKMYEDGKTGFDVDSLKAFINNTHIKAQMAHQFSLTSNRYNNYNEAQQGLLSPFFIMEDKTFLPFKQFITSTVMNNRVSAEDREKSLPRVEDSLLSLIFLKKFLEIKDISKYIQLTKNDEKEYISELEHQLREFKTKLTNFQNDPIFNADRKVLLDFLNKFSFYSRTIGKDKKIARLLDVSNIKLNTGQQLDNLTLFSKDSNNITLVNAENGLVRNLVKHLMIQYGLINGPNPWKNIIPPSVFFNVVLKDKDLNKVFDFTENDVEQLIQFIVQTNSPVNNSGPDAAVLTNKFFGIYNAVEQKSAYITQQENDFILNLTNAFNINAITTTEFLQKLKNNPYVKTTIKVKDYFGGEESSRKEPILLVFDRISGNKAIFKKLNTLGVSWNLFYDVHAQSDPNTDSGYISIITTNNVDNVDELAKTRTTSQKDRIISIDSYQSGSQTQEVASTTETKTINIWYSNKENPVLSNFAAREFSYEGRSYKSVEHAYQTLKSGEFNEEAYKRPSDFVGTKRNAPSNTNKAISSTLMKNLLLESFKQNPEAKQKLLSTGNAVLTHKGGKDMFWENEFPRLLMEVRQELSSEKEDNFCKTKK